MARASLTVPNGPSVQIEGTLDEVKALLEFYGVTPQSTEKQAGRSRTRPQREAKDDATQKEAVDVIAIVNLAKNCDEAEAIEHNILNRASQVDRTLLPLYIVHQHLNNAFGLSSGDINKVTKELGVPVSRSNASTTLSGTASRYVIPDRVRKKGGQPVRYKLSRRGLQYLQAVISPRTNEESS